MSASVVTSSDRPSAVASVKPPPMISPTVPSSPPSANAGGPSGEKPGPSGPVRDSATASEPVFEGPPPGRRPSMGPAPALKSPSASGSVAASELRPWSEAAPEPRGRQGGRPSRSQPRLRPQGRRAAHPPWTARPQSSAPRRTRGHRPPPRARPRALPRRSSHPTPAPRVAPRRQGAALAPGWALGAGRPTRRAAPGRCQDAQRRTAVAARSELGPVCTRSGTQVVASSVSCPGALIRSEAR